MQIFLVPRGWILFAMVTISCFMFRLIFWAFSEIPEQLLDGPVWNLVQMPKSSVAKPNMCCDVKNFTFTFERLTIIRIFSLFNTFVSKQIVAKLMTSSCPPPQVYLRLNWGSVDMLRRCTEVQPQTAACISICEKIHAAVPQMQRFPVFPWLWELQTQFIFRTVVEQKHLKEVKPLFENLHWAFECIIVAL